jgi:hypothetical protein
MEITRMFGIEEEGAVAATPPTPVTLSDSSEAYRRRPSRLPSSGSAPRKSSTSPHTGATKRQWICSASVSTSLTRSESFVRIRRI